MFKPQLCPNDKVDLSSLKYPLLASTKFDGIRAIFMDGEMYSRSLKQLPNKQLAIRFDVLKKYSKEHNIILDGELYATSVTFPELSGIIRQLDCELPDDLHFYCFDMVTNNNFAEPFLGRSLNIESRNLNLIAHVRLVEQCVVNDVNEVENLFKSVLSKGFEGLILRNAKSPYKQGRCTIKENNSYKVKPFLDFDGKIINVVQATQVNADAEKTTNQLGRSVTSKKQGDRHLIEKASAFTVLYNGLEVNPTLAMNDEQKIEVWKNRDKYIGQWITYKGMTVGSKDVVRHPVFVRFRDSKD